MDTSPSPGPIWAWTTAWSLQGAAALATTRLWPDPGWVQFSLMGLGAGLPLLGLYLWLRAREKPASEEDA
ncbi:MAG: hypothetical protein JKY65_07710 [Planctomycetes bacterium]|nr:hypothetical protein [Planctomycetota bacterium]